MGRTEDQASEERDKQSLHQRIDNRAREIWLAGLGALATQHDAGKHEFDSLVQQGKEYEREHRQSRSGEIEHEGIPARMLKRPGREGSVPRENIERSVRAVHVSSEDGEWLVRKTGTDRVRRPFSDKDEALSFARSVAAEHHVDLFVHNEDGSVAVEGGEIW